MTSEWRHVPPISTENKGLRESPPRVQVLKLQSIVLYEMT